MKDLEKQSQMANEKNHVAQELKGETSDKVQSGKREEKRTTGDREVTGTMQELCSEVKIYIWALLPHLQRMTWGRFLNFSLLVTHIHTYVMGVIGLPTKGCLCN